MATVNSKYLTPKQTTIEQDLRTIIAGKLQLDTIDIPDEIGLGDLGFDSLALSDLAEAIEEKFDVQVPNRTLPATLTVGQLSALIIKKQEFFEDTPGQTMVAEPAD